MLAGMLVVALACGAAQAVPIELIDPAPPGPDPGDVDGSGVIDGDDIDLMGDYIRTGIAFTTANYDLSADGITSGTDGIVDLMDVDYLVCFLVETSAVDGLGDPIFGTAYGDFNLDGTVELGDLTRLGTWYGIGGGWAEGNVDRWLGWEIDLHDLTVLATNYGLSKGGYDDPIVTIPEPASASLLLLGASAVLRRRRSVTADIQCGFGVVSR